MLTLFLFAVLFITVQAVNPNESKIPSGGCKEEIQNGMHYTSAGVPYNNNEKCIKACEMKKKAKMNNDGRKNRQEGLYLLSVAYKDKTLEENRNAMDECSKKEKGKVDCEMEEEYYQCIAQIVSTASTTISTICREEIKQGIHSTSTGVLNNDNKKCFQACFMKKFYKFNYDVDKNKKYILELLDVAYEGQEHEMKINVLNQCYREEKGKNNCEIQQEYYQCIAQIIVDVRNKIEKSCKEEIKKGMHSTSAGVVYNNNNEKCIEACILKKSKVMNEEGVLLVDNIYQNLGNMFKGQELDEMKGMAKYCISKVKELGVCETAFQYQQCIKEKLFGV